MKKSNKNIFDWDSKIQKELNWISLTWTKPEYTGILKVSQARFQACNSSKDHPQREKFLMLQTNAGLRSCSSSNQLFQYIIEM